MKQEHLAIIGCGDIGTRVGLGLVDKGWKISALRRNPEKLPDSFTRFSGDYTRAESLGLIAELQPSHVLFTPLPAGRDTAGYERGFLGGVNALIESGLLRSSRYNIMVSSTRVYAEVDGGHVNEESPLTSVDPAAAAIINAERRFSETGHARTCVRASGIYGDLPGMLLARVQSGVASSDPSRISNRIHRDDLAGVLEFLFLEDVAAKPLPGYLVASDSEPTPIGEVEAWLAERLGVRLERPVMGVGSTRGNRQCNNQCLRSLGYVFKYPSFKEGYRSMLESQA